MQAKYPVKVQAICSRGWTYLPGSRQVGFMCSSRSRWRQPSASTAGRNPLELDRQEHTTGQTFGLSVDETTQQKKRRGEKNSLPLSTQVFYAGFFSGIDIGTADGLMLRNLKDTFPNATCAGIEYAKDLMACCESKTIHLIQGDAVVLPIKDNAFDVVIATAIIEHVSEPIQLIREAFRVLRGNGIFIVTTPHPFWEGIATYIGHLKRRGTSRTHYFKQANIIVQHSRF